MAFQEYTHIFGTVSANAVAQFSIDETFRGNPNVPQTARLTYVILRNSSGGSVTVNPGMGQSIVGIGERKKVLLPPGARFFLILPAAALSGSNVTADVGIEGVLA